MSDIDPKNYVDAWDDRRLKLKAKLIESGMDEELADETATKQVQREIERAPPLSVPAG